MKTKLLLFGLISLFFLYSCEKDEENNDETDEPATTNGLPTQFPLKEGTAWKYERTYYENGTIDTSLFDTLYIVASIYSLKFNLSAMILNN